MYELNIPETKAQTARTSGHGGYLGIKGKHFRKRKGKNVNMLLCILGDTERQDANK